MIEKACQPGQPTNLVYWMNNMTRGMSTQSDEPCQKVQTYREHGLFCFNDTAMGYPMSVVQ